MGCRLSSVIGSLRAPHLLIQNDDNPRLPKAFRPIDRLRKDDGVPNFAM
jgi:hypothetical protein